MIEQELLENPSPWMNNLAVEYYESMMRPNMKILEFGSGYSTIWLNKFEPECVVSLESNKDWFDALLPYCPTVDLRYIEDYPLNLNPEWEPFDLIVIDGINRLKCLYWVIENDMLADGGTIIYDDMHRKWLWKNSSDDYQDAWETLEDEDFEMVMVPTNPIWERDTLNRTSEHDITLFAHKVMLK